MAAASSYEDVRNQHLEENKKRLEELGILKISQSLSLLTDSNSKYKVSNLHWFSHLFAIG